MGSKKKWIKYILLAVLIALAAECVLHPVEAKADFGDFSGDTDFGGGGGGGFGGRQWFFRQLILRQYRYGMGPRHFTYYRFDDFLCN